MTTATAEPLIFGQGIRLYDKQRSFVRARFSHRHRRFIGARQAGKTAVGAGESALWAMRYRPGGTGAIIGPDFPKAMEARLRFESFVPPELRKWNGQERRWTIKSETGEDSTVWWMSLSNPDAPRGKVLDWAWLDEYCMFSEEAMNTLRPALAVKRGHSWGTSTPRGMGWSAKEAQDPEVFTVTAQSIDNPAFPRAEWERMKVKHGYDSPFFKQEYRGLFVAFVGQAIPQFDRTLHVNGNGYDQDLPLIKCWDFGFQAHTVCVWAQHTSAGAVRLLGCKTWSLTERQEVLNNDTIRNVPQRWAEIEFVDPSGTQRTAGDRGWVYAMRNQNRNVRYTRRVGEGERLNLIRTACKLNELEIYKDGEGAELLIEAFETAELSDAMDRDQLANNQHPQADIIDAVGYGFANLFGGGPQPRVKVI